MGQLLVLYTFLFSFIFTSFFLSGVILARDEKTVPSSGATLARSHDHPGEEADRLYLRSLKEDDVAALKTLVRALALNPYSENIAFRIGFLLHKMNRWEEAEKYYAMVVRLNPCNESALNNLASIQYSRNDRQGAEETYRKAIACNPQEMIPYYNVGNLLRQRGDDAGAVVYYRKVVKKIPDHYKARLNLGLALQSMARKEEKTEVKNSLFQEAFLQIKKSVELHPNDALNRLQLAGALNDMGRYSEALLELEQAKRWANDHGSSSMLSRIQDTREIIEKNQAARETRKDEKGFLWSEGKTSPSIQRTYLEKGK